MHLPRQLYNRSPLFSVGQLVRFRHPKYSKPKAISEARLFRHKWIYRLQSFPIKMWIDERHLTPAIDCQQLPDSASNRQKQSSTKEKPIAIPLESARDRQQLPESASKAGDLPQMAIG